ncbi:UDP-glycosyltransferase UGT5-like [Athalia rosae]|uniref:UDP-glycosyltransferase UGT5-like n=1 Tax=Athalia rosae TaxID=37344 RepID=UPI0020346505|nr:UDP-glycosyltransferase UGT5-like [Athalia rosae]
MSRFFFIATVILFLISTLRVGNGARILGIFPVSSISHQVVFRGLTLALNKRGHELVVVTPNPVRDPTLKNYKEIDLSYLYDDRKNLDSLQFKTNTNWLDIFWNDLENLFDVYTHKILQTPELKELYSPDNDETFDLVLIESLFFPSLLALATRFDAPIIGITSLGLSANIHYSIGNPVLPSHPSNWEINLDAHGSPTLWERIKNFVTVWKHIYYYRTYHMRKQQEIAEEYFGKDIPDIRDIEKNISLVFVNQQTPISFVRAHVPKYIEIGNFHVSREIVKLPKGLQKILDEATQGFVYMSLGSNVKSNLLTNRTRDEFITAFSKLPYKVLWKFEDDDLPGRPENVVTMKWIPQQGVLAHPNLKVFIYQGGLQSTEEATYHAVPLIGLPVYADQSMQVGKMVSLGVAKKLDIGNVRSEDLVEAIRAITSDNGYKQRMLNLRSLLKDKPKDPLENAIWWTEHVIRRRGAPQLHCSTADEPWYSRYDMDVIAILSAGSVIATFLTLAMFYKFLLYGIGLAGINSIGSKESSLIEKKKRN